MPLKKNHRPLTSLNLNKMRPEELLKYIRNLQKRLHLERGNVCSTASLIFREEQKRAAELLIKWANRVAAPRNFFMLKKILIAEDNQVLRTFYRKKFEGLQGCQLLLAVDGERAIEILDAAQPDLLLLNIHMPKKDGFDVLNHICQKGYKFPVLVISNHDQKELADRALELGATEYFCKKDLTIGKLNPIIRKYLPY